MAQEPTKSEIGGIRAGFHSAVMVEHGARPDTAQRLSNFYLGFFHDSQISSLFYIGNGLEYFQNGLEYTGDSKRVLHTLSIPCDVKCKVGPVFALAGAAVNIKLAERIHQGDESLAPSESDKSNWLDIPVFLGAGIRVLFLTVEARYYWGLIESRDNLYNRYLQVGIGLSF